MMQASPFGAYGLSISVLLVGIMLAVGGIVYGLGYALSEKSFKEFGRNEIVQSLINGALVGGFLILFANGGVMNSFINSVTLANGTAFTCDSFMQGNTAICFAYNYLVGTNQYYFLGGYHDSVLKSVTTMVVSLSSLYAVLGIFKIFLGPILAQLQSAVQVLGAAAISATVQASVLAVVAVSALTAILPLGLVLRTFYPSRRLGSFLIALAISLYVVLPLSYVMNAALSSSYGAASSASGLSTFGNEISGVENSALGYANGSTNSSGAVQFVTGAFTTILNGIDSLLDLLFRSIAYFVVSAFILPAFSLVLTGIALRELSRLLGSETFFGKYNLL